MKKVAVLASLAATLAACAPAVTQAPNPPVLYEAAPADVFAAVLSTIATDPGVPPYQRPFNLAGENMRRIPTGPWVVTASNQPGGFISATAQSTLVTTIGTDSGQRESHTISAAITAAGTNETQIVVTASERAGYLREAIFKKLDATFKRAP